MEIVAEDLAPKKAYGELVEQARDDQVGFGFYRTGQRETDATSCWLLPFPVMVRHPWWPPWQPLLPPPCQHLVTLPR